MARIATMGKGIVLALAALAAVAVLALAGCSGGAAQQGGSVQAGLPDWADKEALAAQAHEVAEHALEHDWDAVLEGSALSGVTAEDMAAACDAVIDNAGEFESFADSAFMQGEEGGRQYAAVLQRVECADATLQFTLSFYEDGTLCGFYVK